MELMKTNIITALAALIEIGSGFFWLSCQKFADRFYYSPFDSELKLDELVHNDVRYRTYTARFFHNKISVYGNEFANTYLQYFDIRFTLMLFSIVGFFGILCGYWYLFRKKNKTYKTWVIVALLLTLPLIEMTHPPVPFIMRLGAIVVPYYILSIYGIWQFIKHHKKLGIVVVLVLIVLSIWYLAVFEKDILKNFCYN
jgi:hypothetical protein